jgi:hypothetical protein
MDDFEFQQPTNVPQSGYGGGFYNSAEAAWILELIKIKLDTTSLPDELKKNLIIDMIPLIENASMTKITRGQVKEFLNGYRELTKRFIIFKVKKKYVPEINYVFAYLRELLLLCLNKSINGWQGDHVFERKTTYDVKQTQQTVTDKVNSWFGNKRQKKQVVTEEMEG